MNITFSENLRELRKINNYSQQNIADLIGIKRCTYASYEEMRSEPPFEILITICNCYGITDLYSLLTQKLNDSIFMQPVMVKNHTAVIAVNRIKKILDEI